MIKLHKIHISEFRGARDLEFDMRGDKFAICGENGTGKSGVLEAIEFVLTGRVFRFLHEGTQGLSIEKHGPHISHGNSLTEPKVSLTFEIPPSKQKFKITRTIADKENPIYEPNEQKARNAIEYIELHPEFSLSRKKLISYILAKPNERSKKIQGILGLSKVENIRNVLKTNYNTHRSRLKILKDARDREADNLTGKLDIKKATEKNILLAINEKRLMLGLNELKEFSFEKNTYIIEGLGDVVGAESVQVVPKVEALKEIDALEELLDSLATEEFQTSCENILVSLNELSEDSDSLNKMKHGSLLQLALNTFDEKQCPVCLTSWRPDEFREVVEKEIERLADVEKEKKRIEKETSKVADALERISLSLNSVIKYMGMLKDLEKAEYFQEQSEKISEIAEQVRDILPLSSTIKAFEADFCNADFILTKLDEFKNTVLEIAEPTEKDKARDFLVASQERIESYISALNDYNICKRQTDISKEVDNTYNTVKDAHLDLIYDNVKNSFESLYRIINQEDEGNFKSELNPSKSRLDLGVDFHGLGFHHPAAYHSEGHQDGMGLSLYLALMSHLFDSNFTFAVLDDVLTSVDSGHRRKVCDLLRNEFPDTQFIITTHDKTWLRYMKTDGLINDNNGFIEFKGWDINYGPKTKIGMSTWDKIDEQLRNGEIKYAAAELRNYLEFFSQDACERLQAKIIFQRNASFTLSDVMYPCVDRFIELLEKGFKIADSLDSNSEKTISIKEKLRTFKSIREGAYKDAWQLNNPLHGNLIGEGLTMNDFKPTVEKFKKLTDIFRCPDCNEFFYLTYNMKHKETTLMCHCENGIYVNLMKPKSQ